MNQYLKNEYQDFIPLWTSLLERETLEKRGVFFYTWLIDKTLSHDMPPSVYYSVIQKVLFNLSSEDRKKFHFSFIFLTLKKEYFEVLYNIIESYILTYNPDLEFYEKLIMEISKSNYNKSLSFKREIRLLLLSVLKRNFKDNTYLVDYILTNW